MNPIRAAAFAALALGPTAAFAEMSSSDILNKLHSIDQQELKAADLAKTKATNKKVQKFASKMTTDHNKAEQKVIALAQQKGVTLTDDTSTTDTLSSMSGADFDRGYIDEMVKGHTDALSFLIDADSSATDPDVKKLVESLKSSVAHHKKMAEQLKTSLDAGKSM
jgi:putative membrane protein